MVPAGAVVFRFPELLTSLCMANDGSCGGASRPFVAGVRGASFSDDGATVAMNVDFWFLERTCNIDGCTEFWKTRTRSVCYAVASGNVTPTTTNCPQVLEPTPGPQLALADPRDGFPLNHTQRRAIFGLPNTDASLRSIKGAVTGARWLGDLEVDQVSPNAWDLAFADGTAGRRTLLALQNGSALELVLPSPDGVPFSRGLMVNEQGLFWASQADEVFALTLEDSLRLTAQPLRSAITQPQTHTVGVRVIGNEVFSLVTTISDNTIGSGAQFPVLEVSLVRGPKRTDAARPLLPFLPFVAHAPTPWSVVGCFTQPLETVTSSQFSLGNGIEISAVSVVPGVPQCVRLTTSMLPRNATLVLSVDGVTARSGDAVRGARTSVVAPDVTPVVGAQLVTLPAGTRASMPLSSDSVLVTNGPDLARVDLAGIAVEPLASLPMPASAGFFYARPDDVAHGLWVSYAEGTQAKVFFEDATGATDLSGADVANGGGLFVAAGDGTVLVAGLTTFLRLSKSMRQPLPRVTPANFRGVLGAGQVLIEDAGHLQVVTLPDTFAQTFALPAVAMGGVNVAAFETAGETYVCTNQQLYRLGASSSPQVAPCSELVRDPRGVLWVSDQQAKKLTRIEGLTLTPIDAPKPYAPGQTLLAPHFTGGGVWFDGDSLRLEDATWRRLVGETS